MEERTSEGGLPEEMIQHIQSFMSGKEAAQTTILSKSWYNAWLTRPNLVFDYRDFNEHEEFSKFSNKTLQRYRDLNLKIDSCKCWTPFRGRANEFEFTDEAIKMGATDISLKAYRCVLSGDVLESKMEGVKVNCSKLKYLRLSYVILEGDLLWDIISSCPLIEGLKLRQCECVVNKREMPLNISKGFELHKLKTLLLEGINICSLFFSDFSSRFPCLKDLSVHNCLGCDKLQILSQSLEFISLVNFQISLKADFDVPNLRKFSFSGGRFLPSMSFPNSCNWESDVSIYPLLEELSAKWFLNLNKLLMNLSLSKVSLNLRCSYLSNIDKAGNTTCLPRPLVENLTIKSIDCATVLDSLIQWCRPVFVTPYWDHRYSCIDGKTHIESLENFYKRLMNKRNRMDDLKKVSVGVFDEAVSGWRTIPWKSLLDTSTSRVAEQRIHFHLRWGQH